MSDTLQNLLDIAKNVLPPIGALIDDEKGEQLAKDVADIVEAVVGHLAPENQMKAVDEDPALRAALKIKIEEAANRRVAAENRAFESEHNDQMQVKRREIADEQYDHEKELGDFQKALENTEAARAHANKAAISERWWVSFVNPALSMIIVIAFFVLILLVALKPVGVEVYVNDTGDVIPLEDVRVAADGTHEDISGNRLNRRIIGNNLEIFYVAFGAMATAFVTVVGFHFGSSSGSKRKTKLQKLYGTRGTLSAGAAAPAGQGAASAASGANISGVVSSRLTVVKDGEVANLHPFERFWMENLSHIEHFNWRELLEKGASNTGVGLNTDPPPELYQNVVPLVNALDRIRKDLGAPVQLTSVYRNPAYNRHVGGAPSSRHMKFDAADFRVLGGGAGSSDRWSEVAKRLRRAGAFRGGIGVYSNFVHIDTRGQNADWDKR